MKTITFMGAQGDVLFRRVEVLPSGVTKQTREGRAIVVAHSETGHHHVVETARVELYAGDDPLVSYLRLDGEFADVEHLRPFDTHEILRLLGRSDGETIFEVRRQREYKPPPGLRDAHGTFRRVAD